MPPGRPLCAGWLTKLGFNSGKWQRRYFMLTDTTLAYYADVGGKVKGQIDMTTLLALEEVRALRPWAPPAQGREETISPGSDSRGEGEAAKQREIRPEARRLTKQLGSNESSSSFFFLSLFSSRSHRPREMCADPACCCICCGAYCGLMAGCVVLEKISVFCSIAFGRSSSN